MNLICRRERISGPSDNESPLAFVRTRTGGLIKRISTLEFIWLLVVFKRFEAGPFYVPADCTNRFAHLLFTLWTSVSDLVEVNSSFVELFKASLFCGRNDSVQTQVLRLPLVISQ